MCQAARCGLGNLWANLANVGIRPRAVHHPHRSNPRMWQPLPAETVEMRPAAFRDLLVVVRYGTAGGKLLFIMIFGLFFVK
jgi:hypothetical protein